MRIFSLLLFILFTQISISQNNTTSEKVRKIDSLLQESHRRSIFNGNALVAEKGTVIYNKAIGFTDVSGTKQLRPEFRFKIGSISKEFDGMGIMILKEQGKLSLNDRLSTFFPQLPQWAQKISVKNLLQYTSGLTAPDYHKVRTDAQVWKYLEHLEKLNFEPGSDYNYNNLDVFLRKRIIEKVSGMSYADFVEKELLKPCGMNHSLLDPTAETPNFTRSFDEEFVQDDLDTYMSGWVASNTEDMYKWVQCLNSGKLISREALSELSESYKASSESPLGQTAYHDGKLLFRYHHGQSDNYEGGVAWLPDPGYTIILLTNNRCNQLADHINAIDAILRGNDFEIPKRSIELSLRAKIYHKGYKAGISFLDSIRKNAENIYNFQQEKKELINTGTWLQENDRKEDALKMLNYSRSRFPDSPDVLIALGNLYSEMGKKDKAFKNYQKAVEMNPENAVAKEKLEELK